MRISGKTKEDRKREKEAKKEKLIQDKMRGMAIKELEKEGKL